MIEIGILCIHSFSLRSSLAGGI